MKAFLAAALAALFLSGCATGDGTPDLDLITVEDARAALAIAEAADDDLGAMCAEYWIAHADDPEASQEAVGPLSAYMKARAVRIRIDEGISDELRMACGPALMESRSVFRRLLFRRLVP